MSTVAVGAAAGFGLGPFVAIAAALGLAGALLCGAALAGRQGLVAGVPCARFKAEMAAELDRLLAELSADIAALPGAAATKLADEASRLASLRDATLAALDRPETGALDGLLPRLASEIRNLRRAVRLARLDAADAARASVREASRLRALPEPPAAGDGALERLDPSPFRPPTESERLADEIRATRDRIADLDPAAAGGLEPLLAGLDAAGVERLRPVRDDVLLRLGLLKEELAETELNRAAIRELLPRARGFAGADRLVADLEAQLAAERVTSATFAELVARVESAARAAGEAALELERRDFCDQVRRRLEALGYAVAGGGLSADVVARLAAGEAVPLDTPWPGYKVMTRVSPAGELATRLVRAVATARERDEVSDYDRQKDREVARAWCRDYDRFLEELGKAGVGFELRLRKEPEEEAVLRVVDGPPARRRSAETPREQAAPRGPDHG